MHFILTSLGTDGDVFPYLGLGAVLKRRGHRVTMVLGDEYEALTRRHELEFASLVPAEVTEQLLANPDFWHPIKTVRLVSQWGIPYLNEQYETFSRLVQQQPDTVIICSPAILPARIVQEKFGVPLASLVLQPWMIASSIAPPVMPAGMTLPRWAPPPVKWLYWRAFDVLIDRIIGKDLNTLRASQGMSPVRRVFRWWFSPQLVLGMFPSWYGPPQRDWPPQIELTGFPMYDGEPAAELSAPLQAFLEAGPAPVAFTFGTGMMHAGELFRAAVDSCMQSGRRGVLITKYDQLVPHPLSPGVIHINYAPFEKLLPRCAAVVHHGGIGTTAKCCASGTPQVIVPFAFDQLDNALRAQKLGVATWIKPKQVTAARLATALDSIITAPVQVSCARLAQQMAAEQPCLELAADLVESLGQPAVKAA